MLESFVILTLPTKALTLQEWKNYGTDVGSFTGFIILPLVDGTSGRQRNVRGPGFKNTGTQESGFQIFCMKLNPVGVYRPAHMAAIDHSSGADKIIPQCCDSSGAILDG